MSRIGELARWRVRGSRSTSEDIVGRDTENRGYAGSCGTARDQTAVKLLPPAGHRAIFSSRDQFFAPQARAVILTSTLIPSENYSTVIPRPPHLFDPGNLLQRILVDPTTDSDPHMERTMHFVKSGALCRRSRLTVEYPAAG